MTVNCSDYKHLKGNIIKGSGWSEPIELKFVEEAAGYIHIVGVTVNSQTHIDQLISKSEFESITIVDAGTTCNEDCWKVFLALEATRYRLATLYDPLLAMNSSKVDPLPHQIEAVYGYVLKLPRIRFLIADDPGAGKTIMAGLIIKELKLRNLVRKILIVAPGHLKDQWRRELKERFEEKFLPVDRKFMDAFYAENIWERENQLITSVDFAKQEDVIPTIASVNHFDLIIVDEAHKMSAYRYGEKTEKTIRYKLGELLSRKAEHLLFLTATPHKGDTENFRLFLDLLEPGFFATTDMVQESIRNKDNPLFIRHVKEELKDFEGRPLFLPRHVMTRTFNLGVESPHEKDLYNDLSQYVNTQYNKALSRDKIKKRNIAFALVILQRRFVSSAYALMRSLDRRRKKLEELLSKSEELGGGMTGKSVDIEELEDMDEESRWKEEEIWETLSVAQNKEELRKEIEILKRLITQARNIIQNEEDAKLRHLREGLRELEKKFIEKKDKKVLIFTESRDTLEYLEDKIRQWGYSVNTIHGSMMLEERVNEEARFKNETQIMVATEAAGEGINLQFCHLMINYDIPWNPTRLEQRMGRIHRYGQQKEVFVINLVAEDTREGKILKKLFDKLDEIRRALGSDKVFDCLGDVLEHRNLAQLLLDAAANARGIDDILREIEITVNKEYISRVKENLGEGLATHFIDYTRIKEMANRAREHRLIPEYTESFFKKAFEHGGGKYKKLSDNFIAVDSIPFDMRKIAEEEKFKQSFGTLLKRYPRATFDKEIAFKNQDAEFVCFGHPLFEVVMEWIKRSFGDTPLKGATFVDPDGRYDGFICFYEAEVFDGTGRVAGKRIFSFYLTDKNIAEVPASLLWDFKEIENVSGIQADLDTLKKRTIHKVVERLQIYKNELFIERDRQAKIKEQYGIRSLQHLILKLDNELIALNIRKDQGENVDIGIRNKSERKTGYEQALEDLKTQIQKECTLTMGMPRFKGIMRIISAPPEQVPDAMRTSHEIEKIGMDLTMKYEREHGRAPEDVSSENLGFDIRTTDAEGNIRYIEVKSRADVGDVALTQNEWFKAKRFGEDYYLYVAFGCLHNPRLHIINNPAHKIEPEAVIESVRYLISARKIKANDQGDNNGCEPPVTIVQETVEIEDKTVLVVNIPKGAHRPYRTKKGQYYIRSSNRCRQASREELLRIFQSSQSLFYDETPIERAQYNDLSLEIFSDFIRNYIDEMMEESQLKNLLLNYHLIDLNGKPTLTGITFFGKNPSHFMPFSKMVCAYIDGEDIAVPPADKKEYAIRIPDILDAAKSFSRLYLKQKHVIRDFEPEVETELPELAIREGLVNAIAHRDYTINSPVRFIIYNNRLEIRTPGKLPNTVTVESMKVGGSHVLRNPTIYNMLLKMKMVTDMGSGVRRIIKTVKEKVGKDVGLEALENEFVLTIPRKT